MGFHGDFIPKGMEKRGGKLVEKRADPYVTIQQLEAKVRDLQRKVDQQENDQLKEGNLDLRKLNGELTEKVKTLANELEGINLHLKEVTKQRDDFQAEHGMILKQFKDFKNQLPPVTPDMQKMADLQRENEEMKGVIADYAKQTEQMPALIKENAKLKKDLAALQAENPKGKKG